MTSVAAIRSVVDLYAEFDRLVDELCQVDTTGLSHDELLDGLRAHEKSLRRMTYASYPFDPRGR